MFTRRSAFHLLGFARCDVFFALGVYAAHRLSSRDVAVIRTEIDALRGEIGAMRRPAESVGTGGEIHEEPISTGAGVAMSRSGILVRENPDAGAAGDGPMVEQIKRTLQKEMGLFPLGTVETAAAEFRRTLRARQFGQGSLRHCRVFGTRIFHHR